MNRSATSISRCTSCNLQDMHVASMFGIYFVSGSETAAWNWKDHLTVDRQKRISCRRKPTLQESPSWALLGFLVEWAFVTWAFLGLR